VSALAFLCLAAMIFFDGTSQAVLAKAPPKTETLVVTTASGRHTIAVEVAETEQQKALGLMFRTSVPSGTGMIFPYGDPQEITM